MRVGALRVSRHIYLIDTLALGAKGTVAAYLVQGAKKALVDCGHATSLEALLQGLAEVGIRPEELDFIIPTHVHLDHAGAAGALARRAQGALVIAHERAKRHLVDPSRLVQSATQLFGEQLMKAYGSPEPIEEARIEAFEKEMSVDLGAGIELRLLYAPGHAPHQLVAYVEHEKALITADSVGILYPDFRFSMIPTTPPPSFDAEQAIRTAEQLLELPASTLLLPHFGVRQDAHWVLQETIRGISSWTELAREALKASPRPDAVLDRITKDFLARAGARSEGDLPAYVKVSLWTSAMGLFSYLTRPPKG
jgi:glyoxylase-like metal-dependent hydrolase (beta-lactamase superfamily II)